MTVSLSLSPFPSAAVAAVIVCLGGTSAAFAQSMPDAENGRYALSTVEGGMIRLDTRTGTVSTCSNGDAGWACRAVPDELKALDEEIGRLQADNEKLKAQLAEREPTVTGKIEEPLPKADSLKKPEPKVAEAPKGDPPTTLSPEWVKGLAWRGIGPANMGGRIVALSVYEADPSTFWVATGGGGQIGRAHV